MSHWFDQTWLWVSAALLVTEGEAEQTLLDRGSRWSPAPHDTLSIAQTLQLLETASLVAADENLPRPVQTTIDRSVITIADRAPEAEQSQTQSDAIAHQVGLPPTALVGAAGLCAGLRLRTEYFPVGPSFPRSFSSSETTYKLKTQKFYPLERNLLMARALAGGRHNACGRLPNNQV